MPVPLLADTSRQLLAALKPLLSPEEYLEVLRDLAPFADNRYIKQVQEHLVALSKKPDVACYLNTIYNETFPGIYGELKGDILPRNPYLVLEEDPYAKTLNPPNQTQRAANLINSSLKFIVSLRNETLKPDLTPKNQNPLTMNCYKNLFGTTRVPDLVDETTYRVSIQKFQHINDSRHIVVICNNQYYSLEVLLVHDEASGAASKHAILFSDHELSLLLQEMVEQSLVVDKIASVNNSVGSITTQNFHHWKSARQELMRTSAKTLSVIDNALFVVCLDSNSPVSDQEKTLVVSHGSSEMSEGTSIQVGTCTSRWYDKLQLVVTKNAVAGIVWESTSMDSTAILRFISDIYTDLILKLAKNINGSEYTLFDERIQFISGKEQDKKLRPVKLVFNKTPELQHLIHLSETRLADIINQHEYKTLDLKLDAHLISKFGVSVDSFLQVAFQITNYTLYGKVANTLEPITTRKFRDSRTELIPVQNDAVARLTKLFITSATPAEKWEAFKECCDIHHRQYRDAMLGKGFERHLIALIHVLKRPKAVAFLNAANTHLEPIPNLASVPDLQIPLLSSPAIGKLSTPELLISNCGNAALHLFGVPPASDQGFGVGYIIHPDKVIVTISSKHRQTDRFLDTFRQIINDIKLDVRSKTNILIDIADSDARKAELKRLRVERELKNVDMKSALTRRPVDLTVGQGTVPLENIQLGTPELAFGATEKGRWNESRRRSDSDGGSKDYDILGGYGYFDFGELDVRSDELSRNESFLNSRSQSTSNLGSRHQSSTNLSGLVATAGMVTSEQDVKQKMSLSERIRDKLSHSTDSFSVGDSPCETIESYFDNARGPVARPKNLVGRELTISRFP